MALRFPRAWAGGTVELLIWIEAGAPWLEWRSRGMQKQLRRGGEGRGREGRMKLGCCWRGTLTE